MGLTRRGCGSSGVAMLEVLEGIRVDEVMETGMAVLHETDTLFAAAELMHRAIMGWPWSTVKDASSAC